MFCKISVALIWMLFHSFMSLYSGAQTRKQCWRLQQAEHSGTTFSLTWLVVMGLMHPRGWIALLAAKAYCDSRATWHQQAPPRSLSVGLLSFPILYTEPGLPHPSCRSQHFSTCSASCSIKTLEQGLSILKRGNNPSNLAPSTNLM